MNIDPQASLNGVRLTDIRSLFRKAGLDGLLSSDVVREELALTEGQATGLLGSLEKEGFVERTQSGWRLTKEGIRLRAAPSAKPLLRNTADRLLHDLLGRIEALNRSPRFLARVERAIVFGSYLSDVDRLGDLDVAIEWQRREMDFDKHDEANRNRVIEEMGKGRHFANFIEQLDWWRWEATLFLRNRKRGLSIHDYASEKQVIEAGPYRVDSR